MAAEVSSLFPTALVAAELGISTKTLLAMAAGVRCDVQGAYSMTTSLLLALALACGPASVDLDETSGIDLDETDTDTDADTDSDTDADTTMTTGTGTTTTDTGTLTGPVDADGDGYTSAIDCDDADPHAYPGALETWYNSVDEDCDGNDGDQDGDGFDAEAAGGLDYDDLDAAVNPGAAEVSGNDVDDDCDSATEDGIACAPEASAVVGFDASCAGGAWTVRVRFDGPPDDVDIWIQEFVDAGGGWGTTTVYDTWDSREHTLSLDGTCCVELVTDRSIGCSGREGGDLAVGLMALDGRGSSIGYYELGAGADRSRLWTGAAAECPG